MNGRFSETFQGIQLPNHLRTIEKQNFWNSSD